MLDCCMSYGNGSLWWKIMFRSMNEEELKRKRFDQIQLYRERFSDGLDIYTGEKLSKEDADTISKSNRKNNWRNRRDLKDKAKSNE